jgi:hypothetical protein
VTIFTNQKCHLQTLFMNFLLLKYVRVSFHCIHFAFSISLVKNKEVDMEAIGFSFSEKGGRNMLLSVCYTSWGVLYLINVFITDRAPILVTYTFTHHYSGHGITNVLLSV